MYRALIVEDDASAAEALRGHLLRFAAERGVSFSVETLGSALELLEGNHPADAIFLDIGLPGINGMEAAEIIRENDQVTPLVFVTDLAQYAVRGYQVDAIDFMVSPFPTRTLPCAWVASCGRLPEMTTRPLASARQPACAWCRYETLSSLRF